MQTFKFFLAVFKKERKKILKIYLIFYQSKKKKFFSFAYMIEYEKLEYR